MDPQKELKINLGTNIFGIDGWVNIDGDARLLVGSNKVLKAMVKALIKAHILNVPIDVILTPPPNFRHINLLKCRLPFKSGSVSYCYTSHFIEHIPRPKAAMLMKEVHRVLKPNGMIRLVVPDLELVAKNYYDAINGDKAAIGWWKEKWPEFDGPTQKFNAFFFKFAKEDVKYLGFKSPFTRLLKRVFVPDMGHQWMYDFYDLKSMLSEAGFKGITRARFKVGKVPDAARLDNREDESIYVEARK